jgi:hypothetical protein
MKKLRRNSMSDRPNNERQPELEKQALAGKYADALLAQLWANVQAFIGEAENDADKSVRLQTAYHVGTFVKEKLGMVLVSTGLPVHVIVGLENGGQKRALDHLKRDLLRAQISKPGVVQ